MTKSLELFLHSCHHIFKCNVNIIIFFGFSHNGINKLVKRFQFFIGPLLTQAFRSYYLNKATCNAKLVLLKF